jgi:hypothetical protein
MDGPSGSHSRGAPGERAPPAVELVVAERQVRVKRGPVARALAPFVAAVCRTVPYRGAAFPYFAVGSRAPDFERDLAPAAVRVAGVLAVVAAAVPVVAGLGRFVVFLGAVLSFQDFASRAVALADRA